MNNQNYTEPYSNSGQYNNTTSNFNYNNTQGQEYYLKKWNWGAFMFNFVWGIGNKCYMPLLCLIPIVNIVMIFMCGAYGNRWLWKTGKYNTPKELYNIQKSWNTAGFVTFIISLVLTVVYIIFIIYLMANGTSSYSYRRKYYY